MRVAENRKGSRSHQMIQRIVAPFTSGDARTIGSKYESKLATGEIKRATGFFWIGNLGHVPLYLFFVVAVSNHYGYVEAGFCQGQ
jgi:hypothetical protein